MRPLLLCVLSVALVGCGDSADSTPKTKPVASTASVPASFFTTTRPTDVKDLKAVRDSASKGDAVTFLARIGGRAKPFTSGQALFVVTDPTLESCEIMADDDHCALPWDYCCEDPDNLKMNVATVRLLTDGRPIRTSADGQGGLETLKYVVVSGTVNDINDQGLFVVDADSIWVGDKPKFGQPRLGSGE